MTHAKSLYDVFWSRHLTIVTRSRFGEEKKVIKTEQGCLYKNRSQNYVYDKRARIKRFPASVLILVYCNSTNEDPKRSIHSWMYTLIRLSYQRRAAAFERVYEDPRPRFSLRLIKEIRRMFGRRADCRPRQNETISANKDCLTMLSTPSIGFNSL